ncbi:MAG: DUF2723 domain-containing protein [Candidatus Latescibacterota bacterium]|nr:DUF2723 domain-containing protein [Candidatus Latescibacterota bacterium]
MIPPLLLHRVVGVGVFVVALLLYFKTMAPSTSFWDTGEFITTSYILGVPHPPGSPLYVLLGRIFSLFPTGTVANRVVFMSVLASAAAVWFTYLTVVALARRALGGAALHTFGDSRDWAASLGAAIAALCLATSYTFWFNATEAEVYAYSLFFVCGGMWLIFYWEGTGHGWRNDNWLYLIAYFFGLGGGLHLLCLLTIPSLVILAWFADKGLRRLIAAMVGASLEGLIFLTAFAESPPTAKLLALLASVAVIAFFTYLWVKHTDYRQTVMVLSGAGVAIMVTRALIGPGVPLQIVILLSAATLIYHLFQDDRRSLGLLVGTGTLFALGYSTYLLLFIRSGLDPGVDMNDPENFHNFLAFLNREQYGTESQLLGMLKGRASRSYQLWHQQIKYFLQQFPFPLLERDVVFRWATEDAPHVISVSLVPLATGVAGLGWQLRRDWRRFSAVFVMFLVMGFGLSFYLNMPDPQPRERHYVFGGMFLAWAMWMGLGWTALVDWVRQRVQSQKLVIGTAVIGLALPAGVGAKLYHIQDRTDDYIAYDYAYNLLQSCDPNSILFTNGDNDTFPLWFLQKVEGIRTDVRVVNLSLLNTGWYIKHLRDREPTIAMARAGETRLTDSYIDSTLCDTQVVDLYKRVWREPKTPYEYVQMGLDVKVAALPGHDLLRIQDIMVIGIVYWNGWERPIHFAITVAASNRTGLDPYLEMQGMTLKLVSELQTDRPGNPEKLRHNLMEVYQFRSITDQEVYKDVNTARLLGNYRACLMTLAEIYKNEGRADDLASLFRWATGVLPMGWDGFYTAAEHYRDLERDDLAIEFMERAGNELIKQYGLLPSADYDNALALASIMLNSYRAFDKAESLYRRAIAKQPERYDGYHELAATLQASGRPRAALQLVVEYVQTYGEVDSAAQDRRILMNALSPPDDGADSEHN